MKPFRFTLQPIRVLREQKEQKAQQAFGEALRLCDQAAFQLQTASDELVAGWNALCRNFSGGVSAMELARTRAWCNVLELRQKERAEALQLAQRAMEAAMKRVHDGAIGIPLVSPGSITGMLGGVPIRISRDAEDES